MELAATVITNREYRPTMQTMTDVVSVPASEIRPFDGITEGSAVQEVIHHEAEQRDPLTGAVTRRPAVTVVMVRAQLVAEDADGLHLHKLSTEVVAERTFDRAEVVRVARPAPVAPCSCGFAG